MRLKLEKDKPIQWKDNATSRASESFPFVENSRGLLIHRPRTITTRFYLSAYISIHYYCGAQVVGDKNLTVLEFPPEGKLVCHACEARAIMAGLPSSAELTGRHVCTGKVRAINSCHAHGNPNA